MQQQRKKKKKRIVIVQMQKMEKMVWSVSQKNNRKGEGSKRASAFVSQEIQSIHAKQVLFLIMPNMPPVSCLEEWLYLRCSERGVEDESGAYPVQLS